MSLGRYSLAAILVICAPALRGDTTYTYTGNELTMGPNAPESFFASVTLSSPLPANSGGLINLSSDLVAFNFDGNEVWPDPAPWYSWSVELGTTGGVITNWNLYFLISDGGFGGTTYYSTPSQDGWNYDDYYSFYGASNQDDPGTWTAATIPEPGSFFLIGIALLGTVATAGRAGHFWDRRRTQVPSSPRPVDA